MELEEQLDKVCDEIATGKIGEEEAIVALRTLKDNMGIESFNTAIWKQSDRLCTIADKLGPVLYSKSW
jgi:hypothetical protein